MTTKIFIGFAKPKSPSASLQDIEPLALEKLIHNETTYFGHYLGTKKRELVHLSYNELQKAVLALTSKIQTVWPLIDVHRCVLLSEVFLGD